MRLNAQLCKCFVKHPISTRQTHDKRFFFCRFVWGKAKFKIERYYFALYKVGPCTEFAYTRFAYEIHSIGILFDAEENRKKYEALEFEWQNIYFCLLQFSFIKFSIKIPIKARIRKTENTITKGTQTKSRELKKEREREIQTENNNKLRAILAAAWHGTMQKW